MQNVDMSIKGDVLTIKVDLSKSYGHSSSGKSEIIASTKGNVQLPGREEKLGLNLYKVVNQ